MQLFITLKTIIRSDCEIVTVTRNKVAIIFLFKSRQNGKLNDLQVDQLKIPLELTIKQKQICTA